MEMNDKIILWLVLDSFDSLQVCARLMYFPTRISFSICTEISHVLPHMMSNRGCLATLAVKNSVATVSTMIQFIG